MSYQVELTRRAERDVDGILAWLAHRSSQGAEAWYERFNQVLEQLAADGEKCNLAPEDEDHDEEVRHVIFKTR
jgi:plasmid stabilization system protein ParE